MFNTITIVGVGLISGSFSMILKEKGLSEAGDRGEQDRTEH